MIVLFFSVPEGGILSPYRNSKIQTRRNLIQYPRNKHIAVKIQQQCSNYRKLKDSKPDIGLVRLRAPLKMEL